MTIVLILLVACLIYLLLEYLLHQRNVAAIPVRIHVNGTRGKSSVTRLIAAGLRAGGIATFSKTTGTAPRIVLCDGRETPLVRPGGRANIKEHISIFRQAVEEGAQAIVIECMAIAPELQWICEHQMVRSTHGLITNAREDHLDVMGPTIVEVAQALSRTIPHKSVLFTAEKRFLPVLLEKAEPLGTKVVSTDPDGIPDEIMSEFSYVEHKENVALALALCESLRVKKEVALQGMVKTEPDPGALKIYEIKYFEREIKFINAFAANDRESTLLIWERLNIKPSDEKRHIVIVNNRGDRPQRSEQFGELIGKELLADYFILVGDSTNATEQRVLSNGLPLEKVVNLGRVKAQNIFEKVLELTTRSSTVIGVGNTGGLGQEIATYFRDRAKV